MTANPASSPLSKPRSAPTLRPNPRTAAAPARVRLQVGQLLRGPLAGALLAHGMQPVLSGAGQGGLALEIREFGPAAAPQGPPNPPGHEPATAAPPLLALLPAQASDSQAHWRGQALQAGALSLMTLEGNSADIDAITRLTARLIAHPGAAAPGGLALRPTSALSGRGQTPDASGATDEQRSRATRAAPELLAALDDAVAHARQQGAIGALLLIGLNRLADVEAALGASLRRHLVDTIEARLIEALRRAGDRHRLHAAPELYPHEGGFAIVWPRLSNGEQARQLARHLLLLVGEPLELAAEEASISANAGISLLPHDGVHAAALIEAARRALHQARGLGAGQCQFHAQDIAPRQLERLRLEARLRRDIAEGRFELHYQPQVDLQTGALTGAEALLRWPDGAGGTLAPDVFIPLAEATGLIVPLGDWVLQRVCRQISRWLARGLEVPRIAINVSPLELRQPDFVARVLRSLADAGLAGRHLCIELTEAALMTDTAAARAETAALCTRLLVLREAGVQLSIDDFGTGCSSLAMLRRLPVDGLKIDRSFVADLDGDGAAICSAIIGLAHTLGLRVVAEGIETDAQLSFLREQGCDEFQGHVLAPALSPTTMAEVLAGAPIQYQVQPAPALPTGARLQSALLSFTAPT